MKHLYLIGGPMGVGKTALCRALQQRLPNCAFLDGDWCWDADPFVVNDETKAMVEDNICHLLNNFIRCSAYENVIFCWVMHQQEIIDGILSRLDTVGCDVKCISLVCSEAALRTRLEKDVTDGIRLPDVIERSVARLPMYEKMNTIRMDTTYMNVYDTACAIAVL